MLVIESMDADSETRRLSPLALDGGGAMEYGPYTDLLNGPMDHGKRLIELIIPHTLCVGHGPYTELLNRLMYHGKSLAYIDTYSQISQQKTHEGALFTVFTQHRIVV